MLELKNCSNRMDRRFKPNLVPSFQCNLMIKKVAFQWLISNKLSERKITVEQSKIIVGAPDDLECLGVSVCSQNREF